jgi:hypothetical protein
MRRHIWILVMLCGCGEPILKNAPKPDPGAVAGLAAAAAAAATLADPQGADRRQEQKAKGEPDNRGVEVKETVPSDVIDRLDHAGNAGSTGSAASAARAARPDAEAAPDPQPASLQTVSPADSPPAAVPAPAAIPLPHAAARPTSH